MSNKIYPWAEVDWVKLINVLIFLIVET